MTSRESAYLPRISDALLVPVNASDDAIFKRRVTIIKSLITELEDENNLIAYKVAKTRRRIEEKKARLAAQQAPESKGFWGGRKTVDVEEVQKPAAGAKKRERTKSKPRASKGAGKTMEPVIPPLSTEELSYLGTGRAPVDRGSNLSTMVPREQDERQVARQPSRQSLNGNGQDRIPHLEQLSPKHDPNDMDVDDFDDY